MSRDLDEDSIEATIRRVAEAKAAKQAEVEPDADSDDAQPEEPISKTRWDVAPDVPTADEADGDVDEDVIAATIRRVAEAQAAKEAELTAADPGVSIDSTSAAPTFDAQPLNAPEAVEGADADDTFAAAIDEDRIAATIRRIEEQRAARELDIPETAEPQAMPLVQHDDYNPTPPPAEPRWQPSVVFGNPAASSEPDAMPVVRQDDIVPTPPPAEPRWQPSIVVRGPVASRDPGADLESTVRTLQFAMETLKHQVAALEQRIGTITGIGATAAAQQTQTNADDDDWDDDPVPTISRLPTGLAPRAAIIRDNPSPMTATAAKLEPLPAPEQHAPPEFSPPAAAPPTPAEPPSRGFDLLPRNYRITVEDKRRAVDLVPLHRALLGMNGVKDMSLLSYANGIAIVSIETTLAIEPDQLGAAVARAMAREAKVEVHNEQTMVVKLSED